MGAHAFSAAFRHSPRPRKGKAGTQVRRALTPQDWARRAYVECLVVVAVDALIMGGIFFSLVGSALNGRSWAVYGYVFMFVPLLSVLAPVSVAMGARLAYLRDRWDSREAGADEEATKVLLPTSPWRWCALLGLPPAVLAAGSVSLLLWLSGAPRVSPVWVVLASCAAAAVVGTAVLAYRLKVDMDSFAAAARERGRDAEASGRRLPPLAQRRPSVYFLKHYALPWMIVAMVLASTIGVKGVKEEALKSLSGAVEVTPLAFSAAVTFMVIAAWTFHEAQVQVRPEVHLGLCGGTGKKPLGATGMIAVLFLASTGTGAAFWIAFKMAGVAVAGVAVAVIIDLVVCSGAALAGSFGGMRWGRNAEARMIEGGRSGRP